MNKDFLNTWPGREIQWRNRWLRTRRLELEGEPQRKGRRGSRYRVVHAQRALIDQLKSFRHRALLGPVALDVTFSVASPHPPALYHLAKYLLDVLGQVQAERKSTGRQYVLYRDDRQVKLLYVRLLYGGTEPSAKGHTWLEARPLRDVIEDFQLIDHLRGGGWRYWDDNDEDSPFFMPAVPDIDRNAEFTTSPAAPLQLAEQWTLMEDWYRRFDQSRVQEAILRRTDAHLASILCNAPDWIAGVRPRSRPHAADPAFSGIYAAMDAVQDDYRELLLSKSIAVPMPGLPRISGEGQTFITEVSLQLNKLLNRRPVFNPLFVPLKVTFLVVPPKGQGKDLDNIALRILPLVHKALRPHPEPWILRLASPWRETTPAEEAPKRRQLIPAHSVTSYEVIELSRCEGDPPNGYLRLALGSGSEIGSTWARISEYAEKGLRVALDQN